MNRYTKPQVTQVVRDQLPDAHPQRDTDIDSLCSVWFVTKRSDRGFQLTENGYGALSQADISYHDLVWNLSDRKHILSPQRQLNLTIGCPFYILPRKTDISYAHMMIRLYDERLAQWIELCGGIQEYLDKETYPNT